MTTQMRILVSLLMLAFVLCAADDPPGARLYRKHCAACHDAGGNARVPSLSALRQRTSGALMKALDSGVMRQQESSLSRTERRAVSLWLGKTEAAAVVPTRLLNQCPVCAGLPPSSEAGSWNAGLTAADVPKPKLKWAFGIPDATVMRSQPAVFGGRVFVGSQDGTVYALDAVAACVHWATEVAAQVRTGIVTGAAGSRTLAFFGDASGRVYALDAATGQPAK
jgi:polyvinyl alcohol dehydrogenase (cytochrome)